MIGQLNDRIRVQERITETTATGVKRFWRDKEVRWGRMVLIGLDGRAKYEQVGYTNVSHNLILRGSLDLSLSKIRFIWRNRIYEPIEPAGDPDGFDDYVTMLVRHVQEEGKRFLKTNKFPLEVRGGVLGVPLEFPLEINVSTFEVREFPLDINIGVHRQNNFPVDIDVTLFPIPADPFIWLQADSLQLNHNDPVTTWFDSSENGWDATAPATPPTFIENATPSGKPAIRFFSTGTPLVTGQFTSRVQPNTVFIVWNASAGRALEGLNDTTRHIIDAASAAVRIFAGSFLDHSRSMPFNAFFQHTMIYNEANSIIRENKVEVATGNIGNQAPIGLTIGSHWNLSINVFSGYIAEIIFYDRLLTSSEIEQTELYLEDKYF